MLKTPSGPMHFATRTMNPALPTRTDQTAARSNWNALSNNAVVEKSRHFAIDCVKMYKHLLAAPKEFVLSKQFVRSGTSIGANVHEAIRAQSKADFASKMAIALKEAQETDYWLDILHETGFIATSDYDYLHNSLDELLRILTAIGKAAKARSTHPQS